MHVVGLAPVVSPNATVLILGSMPGSQSLRAGQYYANRQNLFWLLMEEILGISRDLAYDERMQTLQSKGVAVWDVLRECERAGSLDSAIVPASEVPNDFAWLLTTYATILRICFNGAKAKSAFERHVIPSLNPAILQRLTLLALPSTSPANRYMPTDVKLERWRAALTA